MKIVNVPGLEVDDELFPLVVEGDHLCWRDKNNARALAKGL